MLRHFFILRLWVFVFQTSIAAVTNQMRNAMMNPRTPAVEVDGSEDDNYADVCVVVVFSVTDDGCVCYLR